jgi:membrane associated rhomboid family serine protease
MTAPVWEAPVLRLRGGAIPFELHAEGMRHARSARLGGAVFTRYEDLTHVVCGPRALRLGARSGSYLFRRGDFAEPGAHVALAESLRARIAAQPRGAEQLARMQRLDALAAARRSAPVTTALALFCVAIFGLQLVSPALESDGAFSALLVGLGEAWRLVTANFLHASPTHLALNGMGLFVLGAFAERSLGSRGVGPVLALAGLGAMGASWAAGYQYALGASGLVSGLAGALLWLEFRAPHELPVSWRLPRRLFVSLVAFDSVALLAVPGIAHAAHAGGLAAGALAAAAVGPSAAAEPQRRPGLATLNALALGALLLAGTAWLRSVATPDPDALARRGAALLEEGSAPPDLLNNEAWRIAISESPSRGALEVAQRMAERAAEETDWSAPAILDTLAEVHFLSGHGERARELALAAIALAPDEPYYREQLRRFEGVRAPHDRPSDPRQPHEPPPPRPETPAGLPGPGLRA